MESEYANNLSHYQANSYSQLIFNYIINLDNESNFINQKGND